MHTLWDLVIIGAGPAGMSAALTAVEQGLSVMVVDRQTAPGGQIFRNVGEASPALRTALGPDYARGLSLVRRFLDSEAVFWGEANVWHVAPGRVYVSRQGESRALLAREILIAAGGMMTAGIFLVGRPRAAPERTTTPRNKPRIPQRGTAANGKKRLQESTEGYRRVVEKSMAVKRERSSSSKNCLEFSDLVMCITESVEKKRRLPIREMSATRKIFHQSNTNPPRDPRAAWENVRL